MGIRKTSEKGVQRHVKAVLALSGYFISDLSQPRASMQTPGLPDIYAQHPARGVRLWVEVKSGKNQLSDAQKEWHAVEITAGGQVAVVRSAADMHEYLTRLHERLDGRRKTAPA